MGVFINSIGRVWNDTAGLQWDRGELGTRRTSAEEGNPEWQRPVPPELYKGDKGYAHYAFGPAVLRGNQIVGRLQLVQRGGRDHNEGSAATGQYLRDQGYDVYSGGGGAEQREYVEGGRYRYPDTAARGPDGRTIYIQEYTPDNRYPGGIHPREYDAARDLSRYGDVYLKNKYERNTMGRRYEPGNRDYGAGLPPRYVPGGGPRGEEPFRHYDGD